MTSKSEDKTLINLNPVNNLISCIEKCGFKNAQLLIKENPDLLKGYGEITDCSGRRSKKSQPSNMLYGP